MPNGTAQGEARSAAEPVGELAFLVKITDAQEIGRFSECSGLAAEWEVFEYQEGGENHFVHKLRTRVKYPNLVLKRGVTNEEALLKWFFESKDWSKRGPITVTLMGPGGRPVRSWAFSAAVPVKWQGPTVKAGSNSVAMETLEVAHQGLTPQA